MEVGIFARTFEAPSLAGVLDAVAAHGIRHIQLNTSCMGLSDMPDGLDSAACERAHARSAPAASRWFPFPPPTT